MNATVSNRPYKLRIVPDWGASIRLPSNERIYHLIAVPCCRHQPCGLIRIFCINICVILSQYLNYLNIPCVRGGEQRSVTSRIVDIQICRFVCELLHNRIYLAVMDCQHQWRTASSILLSALLHTGIVFLGSETICAID